jgi:hypothetical protein
MNKNWKFILRLKKIIQNNLKIKILNSKFKISKLKNWIKIK